MPFQSINDYHDACRAQTAEDTENGIPSLYLPNTYFSKRPRPKYCLIASEPALGGLGAICFQALIDRGMTNFLYSRGDFILQYCAYEFLCDKKFAFVVSDLAKGAMTVNNANVGRNARYNRWLPILRDELQFYGTPVRIAVGGIARDFLAPRGLEATYIRHYSGNNYGDFNAFWHNNTQDQHLANGLDQRLREFMKELFKKVSYPNDLQQEVCTRVFKVPLPNAVKGMFLEYRQEFTKLRAKTN